MKETEDLGEVPPPKAEISKSLKQVSLRKGQQSASSKAFQKTQGSADPQQWSAIIKGDGQM